MKHDYPDHFSHKFELPLNKIPTKKSDRIPLKIMLPGLLLGLFLMGLGIYEMANGMGHEKTVFDTLGKNIHKPFVNLVFFDISIMLIGLGIVGWLITSYLRYKKIYFDGKNITVVYRPRWGKKISYKEPIKKYTGVRYRIEFLQRGFINGNRYIVELYHKDPKKIVPLYISTNEKNVRRKWEYYAKTLGLPAMTEADEGLVIRKVDDLNKSLKEMAKEWKLKEKFDKKASLPSSIAISKKNDKIVVKARKIVWDGYNIISIIIILLCGGLLGYTYFRKNELSEFLSESTINITYAICSILLLLAVVVLFRKEKIVFKKYKIVNVHKFFSYSRKNDEMNKTDIEAVDVMVNPATGRKYVAIISDEKTIIFGKKLPLEDLRWLKNYLIYEIIK